MGAFGLQSLRSATRGRRGFALVCLLLFLFVAQSAVTRAHFHFAPADGGGRVVADIGGDSGRPDPRPAHDESKCPLWHAAGICGALAAPAALVLILSPAKRLRVAVDERLILPERFAAAWRSRAPPTV